MRKILFLAALATWTNLLPAVAQSSAPKFEIRPAKPVICPSRPENMGTYRPAPDTFLHPERYARRGQAGGANIIVTYTGFTPEAQAAFQFAVDIWKTQLTSPVPIRVNAVWSRLGTGVLGSAGATNVARNFSGALQNDVWVPIALAEKMAGQNLNGPEADIAASFSSTTRWYYGTDGKTPVGRYDLVTVVLHELCHGLGFVASTSYDTSVSSGSLGSSAGAAALPFTFDTFIENAAGQRLVNASLFTNPSVALGTELTSDGLYFNSPLAAAINPAEEKRPKLYAPSAYSRGSSISHLDEATYPAGDPYSLMSPQVGAAEAIHDPGDLTRKMFDEMGWFITAIRHTPLRDSETPQDYVVTAQVESDGTVTPGSVKLNYSIRNGPFITVAMTATGTAGQYQASIPNPGTGATVRYYLSAADNETGRTYTAPGLPAPGIAARATYRFTIGPDNTIPVALHMPPPFLFANKLPYEFVVQANDNIGVASVTIPYSINGMARTPIVLTKQANGTTYRGQLTTADGPIVAGDVLTYRVVVVDQSARANQVVLGLFTVPIVGLKAPQAQYVNNFNTTTPAADFVGNGFSITQPGGFPDPAIHTTHSYPDRTTLVYQLLVPITVKSDPATATVKFDEIVLAEPGEPKSVFGTPEFYDYVVVEGSLDGETWTPLADGYDSRDNPKWLTAYNSAISNTNSTAVGTPDLYAPRSISLLTKFPAGSVVQVRFRLFADDGAHGWGWAIDNLNIQGQTGTAVKADVLTAGGLNMYPNPSGDGRFQLQARLAKPTAGLEIQVRNALGQQLVRQSVTGAPTQLNQVLDLSALPSGLYMVSLSTGSETVTRKVVIQK